MWNTHPTNSKKENFNDDVSNHLSDTRRVFVAHRGTPDQDSAGASGPRVEQEESWIQSWLWSRNEKPVSLELAFVAVWIGLGVIAIVGTLIGLGEVRP